MAKKPIWKQYDFETEYEFFDYIDSSRINGNFSQLRRLWDKLTPEQKRHWMGYAKNMGYDETIDYINQNLIYAHGGTIATAWQKIINWFNSPV